MHRLLPYPKKKILEKKRLPSTLDMEPSPSTWNPRPSTLDKKIDSCHTHAFLFQFSRNAKPKENRAAQETFPLYHSPPPFKYGYSSCSCGSTRLNELIELVVYMELKKIWTSVTYEEPIILIIKADHSFLHLRSLKVPKIWLDLWKIHLQQLVVVHGGSSWSGSLKGSMD